jgi:hypothetical protein
MTLPEFLKIYKLCFDIAVGAVVIVALKICLYATYLITQGEDDDNE